jgi:hypothetical protein
MAGGLTLAAQIAASLIPPGGIGACFLIRRERANRHGRRLDAQVVDHGGVPLPRPADLTPRVLDD